MSTISEHVYAIRELIKQHHDDSLFTDQFLFKLLTDARAILLQRELDKRKPMSRWNYQSYCISLEAGDYHDCEDCIPSSDCPILKSKVEIPEALVNKGGTSFKVMLLNGDELSHTSYTESRNIKYSKYRKNVPSWTLNNNKLIIFNNKFLRVVLVEGIFKDPSEWENISACSEDGTPTNEPCFDINNEDFPIEGDLVFAMYELVLEKLRIPLSINEDVQNDNQDAGNIK